MLSIIFLRNTIINLANTEIRNLVNASKPLKVFDHYIYTTQYSFHSIRHNVATNFQRAKVEESISARLVGHSTVGATMTYGYYSEGVEFEEALEAVNKLPVL